MPGAFIEGIDVLLDWRIRLLELQPEAAAFAGFGLNADFAAHALGGFAHKSEADAGPLVAFVELLIHIENAFLVLPRYADALVFEPEAHRFAPRFRPNADLSDLAGLDEFDCVGQQVGEALSESRFVGDNRRKRLNHLNLSA